GSVSDTVFCDLDGKRADGTSGNWGTAHVTLGAGVGSAEIQAVRDATTSTTATTVDLPVDSVVVTYVRPADVGGDRAGFAVRSQQKGPALWVEVPTASWPPPGPVVGDSVSFRVTSVQTYGLQKKAIAITGWTRLSQGGPAAAAALLQDLSNTSDV